MQLVIYTAWSHLIRTGAIVPKLISIDFICCTMWMTMEQHNLCIYRYHGSIFFFFALWMTMENSREKNAFVLSTEKPSIFKIILLCDIQILQDIKVIISMEKGWAICCLRSSRVAKGLKYISTWSQILFSILQQRDKWETNDVLSHHHDRDKKHNYSHPNALSFALTPLWLLDIWLVHVWALCQAYSSRPGLYG